MKRRYSLSLVGLIALLSSGGTSAGAAVIAELAQAEASFEEVVGLRLRTVTPAMATQLGQPKTRGAVIVDISPDGVGAGNLRQGDVILQVGRSKTPDAATASAALRQAFSQGRRNALLLIQRGEEPPVFVGLRATKEQLAKMLTPPQQGPSETFAPVKVERPETPQPASVAPAIAAAAASTGPRYALIIGNSQYGASLGRLANPVNDAQSVAGALRAVGFDVDLVTDADQRAMKRAISRFGERLSAAGRGATGLFYYAGHGIQSRGTNYLIPVEAPIEREADLDLEAVAADTVLAQMEEAGAATSIIILDACRNMPLARGLRNASRGLARMEAPNGSFVAYSTAPGSTAADGDGRNSPFATALVKQIGQKGLPIEVMFRGIRRDVLQATGGKQTPWDSSSLVDPFYFVP